MPSRGDPKRESIFRDGWLSCKDIIRISYDLFVVWGQGKRGILRNYQTLLLRVKEVDPESVPHAAGPMNRRKVRHLVCRCSMSDPSLMMLEQSRWEVNNGSELAILSTVTIIFYRIFLSIGVKKDPVTLSASSRLIGQTWFQ